MQLSDAIPGFRIAKAASVSVLAIIDYVLREMNLHTKEDLTFSTGSIALKNVLLVRTG